MTSDAHSSAPVRSFFELLRPANVVTAVADVLAGAAVAGAAWSRHFWWLVPSTACLYAGGVVLNPKGAPLLYGGTNGKFLVPGFIAWGDPAKARSI